MSTPNPNIFQNKNDQTYPNTRSPTRTPVRVSRETPAAPPRKSRLPRSVPSRTFVRPNVRTHEHPFAYPPRPEHLFDEHVFAYPSAAPPPTSHTCYRSFGGVGLLGCVVWGVLVGPCPGSLRQFRLIACQLSALCVGWSCPLRPWEPSFLEHDSEAPLTGDAHAC